MSDLQHAAELIQRYYDDILSPTELAELDRLIVSDADVARLFGQAGQTEHLIQSHFKSCQAEAAVQFELPDAAISVSRRRPPQVLLWLKAHLWGPTGAVLLHVLLLFALLRLVIVRPPPPPPTEYEVLYMDQKTIEIDPLDELPTPLNPPPQPVESDLPSEPSEDVAQPVEMADATLSPIVDEIPTIDTTIQGVLILEGLFSRSPTGKKNGLAAHAGVWGERTEPAVVKALEWLKRNQGADGSWGPNKPAMTGLALLTFLAHGETTDSEAYGETVQKAVRFLVGQQEPDGRFSTAGQPAAYVHAIAAYAICESYAMMRIPSLKPAMEKAVQAILDGQQDGGGWDYAYKKTARRDTSVAGWHVQALKAAYIAGAENPGLKEALDKAALDLKRSQEPESGRFYYTDRDSHKTDSMTGVAVLCLQLMGQGESREARMGLQALGKAECKWDQPPAWPLYAWYYITQARFHQGGTSWDRWNNQFARAFVESQNEDGSWTSPGPKSGGQEGTEVHLGPVYSTTLCALSLQVYYRTLQTYKDIPRAPVEPDKTNDIPIQVL